MKTPLTYAAVLAELGPLLSGVEKELQDNLTTDVELIKVIDRYVMKSGGKRLRPVLMIMAARLAGYRGDAFAGLATVIEYLHSATLLHDDVLDASELRRGNPSANVKWGNAATVLAGDFLFSRAFLLLVEGYDSAITALMCRTAIALTEGEVLQLNRKRDPGIPLDDYYAIIGRKTSSLIAASCQAGAMLAGANQEHIELLRRFGYDLGMAFQIVDDTLDFVARDPKFGKKPANDLKEGTVTLPLIRLFPKLSRPELTRLETIVREGQASETDITWTIGLVREKGADRDAYDEANRFLASARRSLEPFGKSRWRTMLESTTDYVVSRQV